MSCCRSDDITANRTFNRIGFGCFRSVGIMRNRCFMRSAGASICVTVCTLISIFNGVFMRSKLTIFVSAAGTNRSCSTSCHAAAMSRLFKLLPFATRTFVPMAIRISCPLRFGSVIYMSCCRSDDVAAYRTFNRIGFGCFRSVGIMCNRCFVRTARTGICVTVCTLISIFNGVFMRSKLTIFVSAAGTNRSCSTSCHTAAMCRLIKLLSAAKTTFVPMVFTVAFPFRFRYMFAQITVFTVTYFTNRLVLTVGRTACMIAPFRKVVASIGCAVGSALHIVDIDIIWYRNVVLIFIIIGCAAFCTSTGFLAGCISNVIGVHHPFFVGVRATKNDTRIPATRVIMRPNIVIVNVLMDSFDVKQECRRIELTRLDTVIVSNSGRVYLVRILSHKNDVQDVISTINEFVIVII